MAGSVSPRFQSYNLEMVEVTGGRFWRDYRQLGPIRTAEDRYAYRPPINLANPRLRRLVSALGPAYIRVSGTWANTTWYSGQGRGERPAGFRQTLTHAQLRGLADFLRATHGQLVTSFAGSAGVRDASGRWQPAQMRLFVKDATQFGIRIAGAEFLNEPNLIAATGAPEGYTPADWGRDHDVFVRAFRAAAPGALVMGPGSVGDGTITERAAAAAGVRLLPSDALLNAQREPLDAFAYHYYGGVSERCATSGSLSVSEAQALDPDWLARSDRALALYRQLRDKHAPGRPIWLTETAQAACGGSRWASTFRDTPRYVDQLGRLARQGVQVVMHNTLAAGEYALLDNDSFSPRPSYWAALLWSRLMGTRVLAIESPNPNLRMYAHCLRGTSGGVAIAAVNLSPAPVTLPLKGNSETYALSGSGEGRRAFLNGRLLALSPGDRLPAMLPRQGSSPVVAAAGVTFVGVPTARNQACA
jgi:hypothetical protein